MERVDVLIIGGGPAGSSLAWGLRGSGLRVRVLDRRTFPRDKTCAGWVTLPVWSALALDPLAYAEAGHTLQPIRGFQVGRSGDAGARVASDAVISHGIRRCEFDAYLLGRSGAERMLGAGVRSLERIADGWRVNGSIEARLLVGAGGHFCPVARALGGAALANEEPVAAQEIELPIAEHEASSLGVAADIPEIWFTRDFAGYGWVFRKGGFLNVGLGRRGGARLSEHMRAFLAQLRAKRRIPEGWGDGVRGHAYLTYALARRPLAEERVALIGDAAGLAYAKSGEGIRPAVESGLLLARALLGARDVADSAALASYAAALSARFGARTPATVPSPAPTPAWQAALAGRLLAIPAFARRVVVERWFLNQQQAALPA